MTSKNILVTEDEYQIIEMYFQLLAQLHPELLTEAGELPDGTKLTFLKKPEDYAESIFIIGLDNLEKNVEHHEYTRFFIIPQGQEKSRIIPVHDISAFIENGADDAWKSTHSAIWSNGEIIYLQNKLDAAIVDLQADFNREESDESDENDNSSTGSFIKFVEQTLKHEYLANGRLPNIPKVKYAKTRDEKYFTYKVRYVLLPEDGYVSPAYYNLELFSPELYVSSTCRLTESRKQVDIMMDAGENLFDFLEHEIIDDVIRNKIAYAVIKEVQKAHIRGIIHTDIKPANLCVDRKSLGATLVDYSEAFFIEGVTENNNAGYGKGTVGYIAPELFINEADISLTTLTEVYQFCQLQEAPSNQGITSLLKSNFSELLSQKTDIFALGCLLIRGMDLPLTSPYYALAWSMCDVNPDERPDLRSINIETLNTQAALNNRDTFFAPRIKNPEHSRNPIPYAVSAGCV